MHDPFHSPKRRLARAKEHVNNLLALSEAFFDNNQPRFLHELNADGTREENFVTFEKPIPGEMADVAADVIENLRSALDQTGYAVAGLAGVVDAKSAYFPFADDPAQLENVVRGRCKHLPVEIKSLFRAFQPYKGGNQAIWAVNRLSQISKHRLLIPTAVWAGIHIVRGRMRNGGIYPTLSWDREKSRIPVFWLTAGGYFEYEGKLSYSIAFDEVEATSGKPAIAVLDACAGEVESVIRATEAECRRIGLLA